MVAEEGDPPAVSNRPVIVPIKSFSSSLLKVHVKSVTCATL